MNFVNKKNFSIYIFFGSQTGYAESIALYLKKKNNYTGKINKYTY